MDTSDRLIDAVNMFIHDPTPQLYSKLEYIYVMMMTKLKPDLDKRSDQIVERWAKDQEITEYFLCLLRAERKDFFIEDIQRLTLQVSDRLR